MKKRNTRDSARSSLILIPRNRSGQVWIETVIYTLIAFVMIGLVLSYARPKIEELQDKAILQQSTEMMKEIDLVIQAMAGAGNQRTRDITIKEGSLVIDAVNDRMVFELESKNVYSEPGKEISDGNIIILTESRTGYSLVTLTRDYSGNYDLKFEGKDEPKTLSKASNPYGTLIINKGENTEEKIIIDITLI